MNFIDVVKIGRTSAAIIDSAAQRKLYICKKRYARARKGGFHNRQMQDNWQRLAFGLSWESRFYRQGLAKGYGIAVLFAQLFEMLGVTEEPHWMDIVDLGVLRAVSFTEDPGQVIRLIGYQREDFEVEDDQEAHDLIEKWLMEEVHRGIALAHWTDSQITDKADYPAEAVAIWDQIISQAKQFYDYSQICHWRHEAKNNPIELQFNCPGGVFAINENNIPSGLIVEEL